MKTTIQITQETLKRLKAFKKSERESYEIVINELLDEAEEDSLTNDEIKKIQIALENVKKGKVKPIEQVAKEMGIKLK